jgi:hypothetical protein
MNRYYFTMPSLPSSSAGTLGVHTPLGDHLSVEVAQFFKEPDILKQGRSALPGGHNVLVVNDGSTGVGSQLFYTARMGCFLTLAFLFMSFEANRRTRPERYYVFVSV